MNRIYSSLGRRGLGGLWGGVHVLLRGVGWAAWDGGRGWKGCCDDDVGEPLLFPYYSALILHPQSVLTSLFAFWLAGLVSSCPNLRLWVALGCCSTALLSPGGSISFWTRCLYTCDVV